MAPGDAQALLRAALAAVQDCAAQIDDRAGSLLQALPSLPMDAALRANAIELSAGLRDIAGRVTFELALLRTQLGEDKVDGATAVQALCSMDATMMDALAAIADVADRLESAAEDDEHNERPFVLVMEAAGVMLQGLEKARAATQALQPAPGGASLRR
jgi:methyl coenzyme M reductase beta subunit